MIVLEGELGTELEMEAGVDVMAESVDAESRPHKKTSLIDSAMPKWKYKRRTQSAMNDMHIWLKNKGRCDMCIVSPCVTMGYSLINALKGRHQGYFDGIPPLQLMPAPTYPSYHCLHYTGLRALGQMPS